MELKNQKRLAAAVLKCSGKKVRFSTENLDEIKEAITKADIKSLINQGVISLKKINSLSRSGARKNLKQKRSGNSASLCCLAIRPLTFRGTIPRFLIFFQQPRWCRIDFILSDQIHIFPYLTPTFAINFSG